MYEAPPYSKTLTEKDWQKKKGAIAKIAGNTGIGGQLKLAKSQYDAVNWRIFRLAESTPGIGVSRTLEDIETGYSNALKQGPALKKLYKTLRSIEVDAQKLAAAWGKKKTIPKKSIQHAELVSTEAKKLSYAVAPATITDVLKKEKAEVIKSYDILQAEHAKINTRLKKYVVSTAKGLPKVTLETYGNFWSEHIRGIGTSLPIVAKRHPELAKEWDVIKTYARKEVKPKDESELTAQKKTIAAALKSLAPKLKNLA